MFSGFGASVFGDSPFGGAIGTSFEDYFRCYPISTMPDQIRKDDANYGGKIFLPSSALNKLTMLHIRYPMLFKLTNEAASTNTHSGVLEFIAEEGRVYVPQWMMTTLNIEPGQILKVNNCDLPLGSFVKIEPQSVDFLEITDPKAVLENALRKFSTLTVDDIIQINYNNTLYGIKVLEVKPDITDRGICVVETDLETDFAPPVGYVEPEYKPNVSKSSATPIDPSKVRGAGAATMAKAIKYSDIVANASSARDGFKGSGQKLSGKPVEEIKKELGIEDLDLNAPPVAMPLPSNQLFFGYPITLLRPEKEGDSSESKKKPAYFGTGQTLRQSKKRKDKNDKFPPLKNHSRSPEFIEID